MSKPAIATLRVHKAPYECSSPDESPKNDRRRPDGFLSANLSVPATATHLSTEELRDFPQLADAERRLEQERSTLQATLEDHDRHALTQEEMVHALTHEVSVWKRKSLDLQREVNVLRGEKEELSRSAINQVDSLRTSQQTELRELRSAKSAVEHQLQRAMVDIDESKEHLNNTRRQLREVELRAEELRARCDAYQKHLSKVDSQAQSQQGQRRYEQESTHQSLVTLRSKFDSLERLCETLRSEKDVIEKQSRDALMELQGMRTKQQHGVLVDVRTVHDLETKLLRTEEQLQAAHLGNARLLRLMAECPDLHRVLRFNEITQDFVFIGYSAVSDGGIVDATALELLPGTSESEVLKQSSKDAWRERKGSHNTGGSFGVVVSSANTRNRYLLNGPPTEPLSAVPNAMRHLHDAIRDENDFLHRTGTKLSDIGASQAGASIIVPPSNNLMECKSNEKFYWIPRAVLGEAQAFKQAYFPKLSMNIFFPFLYRLNQIWRQREQHMVSEAKRLATQRCENRQQMKQGSGASKTPRFDPRADYEARNQYKMEDDVVFKELDALRRDVRLRVSSRAAQDVCKQYDVIARLQIQRATQLQSRVEELALLHNRLLADRAPEVLTMQAHLRTLSETVRSIGRHVSTRLCGGSTDIKRFLNSLESASERSSVAQSGLVSVSVLTQLMNCIKDFAGEVHTEATVTMDSLRRISDAAEHAACVVPPIGITFDDDGEPPYADLEDDEALFRRH